MPPKCASCCCGYSKCQQILEKHVALKNEGSFIAVIKPPKQYKLGKAGKVNEAKRKDDNLIKTMYRRRTFHHLKISGNVLSKKRLLYNKFHHPEWQHKYLNKGTTRQAVSIPLEDVPAEVTVDAADVFRGTSNQYLLVPNAPLKRVLEGLNKDGKVNKKQKKKENNLATEMAATAAPHMKNELQRRLNEINSQNKEIATLRQLLKDKKNKLQETMQEKSDIATAKDLLEIEMEKLRNIASDDEPTPFSPFGVTRATLTDSRWHDTHPWAAQFFFGMVPLHARKSLEKHAYAQEEYTPPDAAYDDDSDVDESDNFDSSMEEEEEEEGEMKESDQVPDHLNRKNAQMFEKAFPKNKHNGINTASLDLVWQKATTSWVSMVLLLTCVLFPDLEVERSGVPKLNILGQGYNQNSLTPFEQVLVTKMFLKTGYDHTLLGLIWGVDRTTIGRYIKYWLPRWKTQVEGFVRLNLDKDFIDKCQPKDWVKYYGMPIACTVDGKVITTECPRRNSVIKKMMYSNKNKQQGMLGMTWSGAGSGLVLLVTDLYAPCANEEHVIREHKSWLVRFPPGTGRLVDRGMSNCTQYYENLVRAFYPAFMRGRKQLSRVEIIDAKRQSANRYTCETLFSRVVQHKILDGLVKKEHFKFMNDAWLVGHFGAQLYEPLIESENYSDLAEIMKKQDEEEESPMMAEVLAKLETLNF